MRVIIILFFLAFILLVPAVSEGTEIYIDAGGWQEYQPAPVWPLLAAIVAAIVAVSQYLLR